MDVDANRTGTDPFSADIAPVSLKTKRRSSAQIKGRRKDCTTRGVPSKFPDCCVSARYPSHSGHAVCVGNRVFGHKSVGRIIT